MYVFRIRPVLRFLAAFSCIVAGLNCISAMMLAATAGAVSALLLTALILFVVAAIILTGLMRLGGAYLRTWR